jgi:hypothetical protein
MASGHVNRGAPTNAALVKKTLANSERSTHGPSVWTGRALQAENDDWRNAPSFGAGSKLATDRR